MKTVLPKMGEIERAWYVVDAEDQVLGRLASRVATILITPFSPECRHFDLLTIHQHHHHPELRPDFQRPRKQPDNPLRHRIGHNIVVLGGPSQQPVAHTPPRKQGLMTLFAQAANNFVSSIPI